MAYTVRILNVSENADTFDVTFEVSDGGTVLVTHTQGFPAVLKRTPMDGKGIVADDDGNQELVDTIVHEESGEWEWTSSEVVREAIANFVRDVVERRAEGPPPVAVGDTFEV